MSIQTQLLVIFILLCCSAFFSSSETALFSLNRLRLKRKHEASPVDTWFVNRLLQQPARLLRVILIGNEVTNTATAVVVAAFCFQLSHAHLPAWLASLIPVLVATPLLVIFGEIIPKAMAIKAPEAVSRFNAPFLTLFFYFVRPLQWLIGCFVTWFLKFFLKIPVDVEVHGETAVDEATFRSMLDLGHIEGEVKSANASLSIEF